jgi:hypothetical protein
LIIISILHNLGEVVVAKITEQNNIEQSSSDLKGPDIYGGKFSKAASKPHPPKSCNLTSRDICIARPEEATDTSSTAKPNVIMHPPVDYQQTPTHPHGSMTTVPIPFQPIHDYTGMYIKYLII